MPLAFLSSHHVTTDHALLKKNHLITGIFDILLKKRNTWEYMYKFLFILYNVES